MKLGISDYKKYINRINGLALPILLSFITNFLFTIGDQAIIGRTSITEFASVSLVSNLLYALTGSLGILALSVNIIGSKLLGENKKEDYISFFKTAFSLVLIIGLSFEGIILIFGRSILGLGFHMSKDYLTHSYNYLSIAGLGLGLNMMLFIFSSYFKTIEKTTIIFKATTISAIINLIVDYTLVFGKFGMPRLGVSGAAIGTVIGLFINVILYYIHFNRHSDFKLSFKIDLGQLNKLIRSYLPLLGQDLLESSVLTIGLMALISRIGESTVATYNLTNTLMQAMVLPIYAYSSAMMTITAKSAGGNQVEEIRTYKKVSLTVLSIGLFIVAIVLYIVTEPLARLITDKVLLVQSVKNIVIFAILVQGVNLHHQIRRYMLNALSLETWVMHYSMFTSMATLLIAFLATIVFKWNLKGIYVSMFLSHLMYSIGFELKLKNL